MADAKLNKDVFGLSVDNHELVKLAYDVYLANSRSSHAKTLKRGEVRGGGKKPWKQKGTGRARFGSTRNPIWRHGGVAFGRTGEENFTKKISKSAKLQAVRQALSMQNKDKNIVTIADFNHSAIWIMEEQLINVDSIFLYSVLHILYLHLLQFILHYCHTFTLATMRNHIISI